VAEGVTALRRLAALLLLFLSAPLAAQDAPEPEPERTYATVRVTLQTSLGPIVLALESERAPRTTANFLSYVDQRRLDGMNFYRAMRLGPGSGIVQGGVTDPARFLPPVAHEPTSETGLSHVDGAISLARTAPGTARADFFISVGPIPGFDAGPNAGGDLLGFAVFGRVVEGMDVVRSILEAPTSATEGEGVMRGQMLSPRIRIVSARRTAS